ncbi:MAG: hypothetical protein HY903_04400 [Deltaproteobacteria bacterium]|nr:hypothetical protein [Deltaproteobacteria bacterium]
MMRQVCKITGCGAAAWSQEMCNFHAFIELQRTGAAHSERPQARHEGRTQLQANARSLGIKLAEPARVLARAVSAARRPRSPVA